MNRILGRVIEIDGIYYQADIDGNIRCKPSWEIKWRKWNQNVSITRNGYIM